MGDFNAHIGLKDGVPSKNDKINPEACHVFECVDCSQYVLTTIGQAFELRYKMYLNSPHPEPLQIRNTITTGDSWSATAHVTHEDRRASLPEEPPYSPTPGAGIYSDLPEFPTDILPSPSPSPSSSSSSKEQGLPSLTTVSEARPRVYSQLPGFPTLHEDEESLSNGAVHPRLENPYDTIHTSHTHKDQPLFPPSGVYSEPGEITSSSEEPYSARMMTIKQSPVTSANSELIDLTPPLDQPNHVYSNTGAGVHNGTAAASAVKMSPVPKPRPVPCPRVVKKRVTSSSEPEAVYDDLSGPFMKGRGHMVDLRSNDYDDPDALHSCPTGHPVKLTEDGLYDDIQDVLAAKPRKRLSPPPLVPKPVHRATPPVAPKGGQSSGGQKSERGPRGREGREPLPNLPPPPPIYDDPTSIIQSNGVGVKGHYENPDQPSTARTRTPKFDDTIYAIRQDMGLGGEEEEREGGHRASDNMSSLREMLPDPLAPLPTQQYFHGLISRVEAEALLEMEGEFLVRESAKIPGQFVLSGVSHNGAQHLLLMDKAGKVKSRDHDVDYFTSREIPLVIGKSQVFLRRAVINAYPGRGQH